MATHRKAAKPDTIAHRFFVASALCLLAAMILVAILYPVALVIGVAVFLWLRYEIRKAARKAHRHLRRFF